MQRWRLWRHLRPFTEEDTQAWKTTWHARTRSRREGPVPALSTSFCGEGARCQLQRNSTIFALGGNPPHGCGRVKQTQMRWGPRFEDRHLLAKVTDKTLVTYRRALVPFTEWLIREGTAPVDDYEWDNALLELKRDKEEQLSPAKLGVLLAAVEFFLPRLRGGLQVCHQVLRGWRVEHITHHTIPMGFAA